MKTFFTRTASALVFVAVMLGGILWADYTFFLLFFWIGCFALQEYFKLLREIDTDYAGVSPWHKWGATISGAAILLTFTGNSFSLGGIPTGLIGWWIAVIFLLVMPLGEVLMSKDFSLKNIGYSAIGLLYVIVPFGLLIHIRMNAINIHYTPENVGTAPGWLIPLLLIIFIWINDTMAYIVGSLIGRTPFAPAISPKKTIEGTVGGMLLAVATAGVYGHFWGYSYLALQHWIALALIAAIFGTIGDLIESKLKRMAGVKDSGRIMPGHGGFLDRFDSLLLAAPFAWIYVQTFMMS